MLLLPALLVGTAQPQELLLPLTLAYLLSAHVPFRFPMPESAVPIVEHTFDGILNGLPKESKGILYLAGVLPEQIAAMVRNAALVLTSDSAPAADLNGLPAAVFCRGADHSQLLLLRNVDRLADSELKSKLAGCAQLINLQSSGFISEGHFSLSW